MFWLASVAIQQPVVGKSAELLLRSSAFSATGMTMQNSLTSETFVRHYTQYW